MPGFCGYVGRGLKLRGGEIVDDMCRMLIHTGEHQAVKFQTGGLSMAVLARADLLSPMPFVDDRAGMGALVEGEIYNLDEVFEKLEKQGGRISCRSQAEAALCAYLFHGSRAGLLLNGAFCMFLWDKAVRKLTIINDRLGLRPLYYTRYGDDFFFASELKAFTAIPGFSFSLDRSFVYQFLMYGFPLGEITIAEGVSLLPMATVAEVTAESLHMSPYWGPENWPSRCKISLDEAHEGFTGVFSRAQSRSLGDNLGKGVLLSGGIDSRIIAADAVHKGHHLQTFTFGEKGCLDAKIAHSVAKELELSNTFFPIGPAFLTDQSLETCWLTDGMFNVFHAHGVSTYPAIADRVKVILSGMEQIALYLYKEEIQELQRWSDDRKNSEALFRYMYEHPSLPINNGEQGVLTVSYVKDLNGESARVTELLSGGLIVQPTGGIDPLRTLEWLGLRHRQRRFTLMGQLLIRNWAEVRAPLMDSEVIMFAMSLPDELRAEEKPLHISLLETEAPRLLDIAWQRTGLSIKTTPLGNYLSVGKNWVARKAGNCYARLSKSRSPWNRRKLADYHMWLVHNDALRRFVSGVLLSPRTLERGIYREDTVRRMLDEEFTDSEVHTELIGRMITLELAMRLFFDGEKPSEEKK